jgi:hypothetical protein
MNIKLTELEKQYSVNLSLIKEVLDGKIRNCINHERVRFENPNLLIFMEETNGKMVDCYQTTDELLLNELLRLFTVITSLHHVETTVIISTLEPLLKLSDEELAEYIKTGKLTSEMQKKIESS